jgi:branched-chain amino acid transport system substrate-binding protein
MIGRSRSSAVRIGGMVLAAAMLVAAGGATSASAASKTSKTPFLLGEAYPLTGSEGAYGVGLKDTEAIAVSYINQRGGILGHPIKVTVWDTQAEPAVGIAATQAFIGAHVNAVEGYFDSSVTIPSIPLLEQANIPLFGGNPSTPALATMHLKNFVRITGNDRNEGTVQAAFVRQKLGLSTAVVIDDNETFGDAFAAAFASKFKALGGTIAARYTTTIDTTDFTSVLAQVQTVQPQIVEYSGFDPAAALLLKQMRADGITAKYVTDSSQYGSVFTSTAGATAAVGAYMTNVHSQINSPLYKYLQTQMQKRYHQAVTSIDANGFDAIIAIWKTAELAHSIAPAKLIAYMHRTTFQGATGKVSFLPDGDRAQISYTVIQVTPSLTYQTVYTYAKTLS